MSTNSVATAQRQVRTTVAAISPRSALKIGAAVGICLFVAWMLAALLTYILLGATGVWDRVNSLAGDLLGSAGVSTGTYFGLAAAIGVLEVVVAVLVMPLAALLYNAVAGYVGGFRITLAEGVTIEAELDETSATTTEEPLEDTDTSLQERAENTGDAEGPAATAGAAGSPESERPDAAAAGWGG